MNKQLTLIEVKAFEAATSVPRNAKNRTTLRSGKLKTEAAAQAWWKLSMEEKQQGLAGVRAIRAILQNLDLNGSENMAKAS